MAYQETQPSDSLPDYAADRTTNVTNPGLAVRMAGVDVGADAVSNNWNWVLRNISRWIQWFKFRGENHVHGNSGSLGAPAVEINGGVTLGQYAAFEKSELENDFNKIRHRGIGTAAAQWEADEVTAQEFILKDESEPPNPYIKLGLDEDGNGAAFLVKGIGSFGQNAGIKTPMIQMTDSYPIGTAAIYWDGAVLAKENVVKSASLFSLIGAQVGGNVVTQTNFLRGFGKLSTGSVVISTDGQMSIDFPSIDGINHFASAQIRNTEQGSTKLFANAWYPGGKVYVIVEYLDGNGDWKTLGATNQNMLGANFELQITVI